MQHYYNTFDNPATRASLAALYQPQSMLTFEGTKLQARPSRGALGALFGLLLGAGVAGGGVLCAAVCDAGRPGGGIEQRAGQ